MPGCRSRSLKLAAFSPQIGPQDRFVPLPRVGLHLSNVALFEFPLLTMAGLEPAIQLHCLLR